MRCIQTGSEIAFAMHSSLAIPNHSHAVRLCCFNMTCVLPCVPVCSPSVHGVMFFSLPLVFQTGEFSARFLLKLPVDFSDIPVYLLKVTNQPTSPPSYIYLHTQKGIRVRAKANSHCVLYACSTAYTVYRVCSKYRM